MGMSIKTKLFQAFVRKAMKKYIGNEQAYIDKRLSGQQFEPGQSRESSYTAPAGYIFQRKAISGVNFEHLHKIGSESKKVIYVLHGGAYHSSMTDLYCGVMERLSNEKYDVFAIDYRTAPKDVFPKALDDAITGYAALYAMGYNAEDIIVAGDSAGGGLALAMALKLHEKGREIPRTYILSSPWVNLNLEYTANQKAGDVLFGWGDVLEMCANTYANGENKKNPFISPVYGDLNIFKDCNFYISVAKGEMLERQGTNLAADLKKAGAYVSFDCLESGVHDVITMYMLKSRECKDAWNRIHQYIDRMGEAGVTNAKNS